MPEIKHNFAAAKMNKDLDERLVANGEYRDAMNVQVRTTTGDSEGVGDAGTVQNIQGTKQIFSEVHHEVPYNKNDLDNKPTVVGSVADEKNNKAYFFVSGLNLDQVIADSKFIDKKLFIDTIVELDTGKASDKPVIKPVLVDIHAITFGIKGNIFHGNQTQNLTQISVKDGSDIRPGMSVTAYTFESNEAPVFRAEVQDVFLDASNSYTGYEGTDMWTVLFTQETSLNFGINEDPQWGEVGGIVFRSERILNFSQEQKIPAINIVGELLLWTDNYDEPKKINIKRCLAGTINYTTHTSLTKLSDNTGSNLVVGYEEEDGNGISPSINKYLKKEHITVIRKAPKTAPVLEMRNTTRDGETIVNGFSQDFLGNDENFGPGTNIVLEGLTIAGLSWTTNDILIFKEEILDVEKRGIITATINNYDPLSQTGVLDITIISVNTDYIPSTADIVMSGVWTVSLVERDPLFELKMSRFSTRYKYIDGEYSSFGPWSELAFLPGSYDYNHRKGFNLGMVNTVRSLKIKNIIPHERVLPFDVVAVDVLWKTTESPNVYIVKTITKGLDPEWDEFSLSTINKNLDFGEISITSEIIHKVVEANQLLRSWDNVPRYALSQEIAANRVVYGNYVQGYDINSAIGLDQTLVSDSTPSPVVPKKSVKSIRNYKFGMVFGDKYGRETPVISGGYLEGDVADDGSDLEMQDGDVFVSKEFSQMRNRFQLKQIWDYGQTGSSPESWIEYVKYYVKETSNEYYNLIMDRWYEAEDGNIWISFASADRNKVDEETYLNLKSVHGEPDAVTEKARYKIISIKNEPPDFIRVEPRLMGMVEIHVDDYNDADAQFGVYADDLIPDTSTLAPIKLMNNTALKLINFDNFLKDYTPKGDLKIRVVGKAGGVTKKGFKWQTISYHGTTNDDGHGLIRWRKPFLNAANMIPLFEATGDSTADLKLFIEFKEDVVVNTAAQFDGKFFVKLEKDAVIENKIMNFTADIGEYYNAVSWLVGYVDSVNENPALTGPRKDYQWFKTTDNGVTGATTTDGDDDEWNNAGTNVASTTQLISNWQNGNGPFSGDLTPQQAGEFLALGCDNTGITNAYQENAAPNGDSIVNWRDHTKKFWHWTKQQPEIQLKTRMFIDSARTKYAKLTGGGEGVDQVSLNDGGFYNKDDDAGTDRPLYYYKPTGIDQGYKTGSGYGPTINGEAGRIAVSILDKWGWIGEENNFKNHMLQEGNKFRFNNDPDKKVYQIVGTGDIMNNAKNYGAGGGYSNNDTVTFGYSTQSADGLFDYQLNAGPTLENIVFGGEVINGGNTCGDCSDVSDEYCVRHGFRTEFRLFDTDTGQLANGGTRGIDFANWDPRGELCHDARESCIISSVVTAVEDPEAIVPTSDAACFETEPKEDIGLDIYYEASQAIPMNLTSENSVNYIPYHSKVTLRTGVNSETEVAWNSMQDHRVGYIGYQQSKTIVYIEARNNSDTPFLPYVNSEETNIVPTGSNQNKQFAFEHTDGTKTIASIPFTTYVKPIDKNGEDLYLNPTTQQWGYDEYLYLDEEGSLGITDLDSRVEVRFIDSDDPTGFYQINSDVWKQPIHLAWHNCYSFGNGVESDRIRDDYNAPQIDNGVKVSTTFLNFGEERKQNGLIYSGLFNSISSVNNLNEFNQAEKITKDLNPTYGSIQALKTRDSDVVVFTEDKVLKITTNKDALFNADGNAQLTATNRVLGTAIPFAGNYGISNNPESLAADQFRLYFTDMQRGAVLRLSGNGITPISNVGMKTWFRDNLKKTESLLGTFDTVSGEYNLTLKYISNYGVAQGVDTTVSFNEGAKGWTSFKSFCPEEGVSVGGRYITAKQSKPKAPTGVTLSQTSFTLWQHNCDIINDNQNSFSYNKVVNRNVFYAPKEFITNEPELVELNNYFVPSSVDVIFNDIPGNIKSFTTASYEGSQGLVTQFTDEDILDEVGNPITVTDGEYYNLTGKKGWWVDDITTDQSLTGSVMEFKGKEGKWYNRIDGGDRGDLKPEHLNEFSVQGIGFLSGTVENLGTTVVQTTSESDDGLTETTTTITTVDNGNGTSTATTVTDVVDETGINTTTTVETTTNNDGYAAVITPDVTGLIPSEGANAGDYTVSTSLISYDD